MYQIFPIESTASLKTYFHKSYEQQLIANVFPLISAGPQISVESHKRRPLIRAFPLINAALLNVALIAIVTIFY